MNTLFDAHQPGYSLPREFYIDPAIYQADLERVWYHEWLFVAHDLEVPRPGDYVTVQIGDYNLVIIRGDDHQVRALHNVCRHRGSQLCDDERGSVRRRIVCPYHQWSYDLDGNLAKARKTGPDFDADAHNLATAACETVGGMVFVSLAAEPPDISPLRDMFARYLAPFNLGNAKVAFTTSTIEHGNWKLVMENNRECYHCVATHPELCATFPEAPLHAGGGPQADIDHLDNMVEHWETLGLPSRFEAASDNQFRAMRMPLLATARSMTTDGEPAVARRFGDLPADNVGDVLLYHYPNSWNHYMADHAVTFRISPIGPTQTRLTTCWLVPSDAVEGVDYNVDALTSVWQATNAQDVTLVERAQRGVTSPAYRPGPYSPDEESGVIQFIDWYHGAITRRS